MIKLICVVIDWLISYFTQYPWFTKKKDIKKHNHKIDYLFLKKERYNWLSVHMTPLLLQEWNGAYRLRSTLNLLIKKEKLKSLRNMNLISVSQVQDFHMGPLQHLPQENIVVPKKGKEKFSQQNGATSQTILGWSRLGKKRGRKLAALKLNLKFRVWLTINQFVVVLVLICWNVKILKDWTVNSDTHCVQAIVNIYNSTGDGRSQRRS